MLTNVNCSLIDNINWIQKNICGFSVSDTVDVWRIFISDHIEFIPFYEGLLSADEHGRARRYRFQKDKDRFTISRGALRLLLGRYLHVRPTDIAFETGANKKPVVKSLLPQVHYNTTHSSGYILIAFCNTPLGIDAEKIDPLFPYAEVLANSFSPHEVGLIENAETPAETFYILWTRKEALLKATGKGIDDDMPLVPSIDGDHTVDEKTIGAGQNWLVESFLLTEGYACSVASTIPKKQFFVF